MSWLKCLNHLLLLLSSRLISHNLAVTFPSMKRQTSSVVVTGESVIILRTRYSEIEPANVTTAQVEICL